jgi:hypothetical protein
MRKSNLCLLVYFTAIAGLTTIVSAEESRARQTADKPNTEEQVEIRDFDVRVDNKLRGTHRLAIKKDGDTHQVGIQTDIKIDLIVYAYVFTFRGTEVWREGQLLKSEIRCVDGGKERTFALKTTGAKQEVIFNGKPVAASPRHIMTTAYWRLPAEEMQEKPFRVINVDNAKSGNASIEFVGKNKITIDGKAVLCRHCKIDGPSPAELWFDENGLLVHQKSIEEGHNVELKLKQIRFADDEE